jgi:hypothetical protein
MKKLQKPITKKFGFFNKIEDKNSKRTNETILQAKKATKSEQDTC